MTSLLQALGEPWLDGVHALLVLLTGLLAVGVSLRLPHWRVRVMTLVGLAAAWWALAVLLLGPALPVSRITLLREGFTIAHLEHVAGRYADVGPVPPRVWRPWLVPGPPTLRQAVTTSLVVTGWAGLGVGMLTWGLGRRLGLALLLGLALSPGWWSLATTPLHAPQIAWATLMVALAWTVAREQPAGRGLRGLAVVVGLGWCVSILGMRDEALALAASGALALLGAVAGGPLDARIAAGMDRLGQTLRRGWPVLAALLLAWVLVAAWLPDPRNIPGVGEEWRWLVMAVHPRRTDLLLLPVVLAAVLPLGTVGLALHGSWRALRTPLASGLLPVVLAVLFLLMRVAAHGGEWPAPAGVAGYELLRYTLILVAPVSLLALWGLGALPTLSSRTEALLALLCLVPALPWLVGGLDLAPRGHVVWPLWQSVRQDPQREMHRLAARLEEAPSCGLLTVGLTWGTAPEGERLRWAAIRPHLDGGWVAERGPPVASASLDEAVEALVADLPCAVGWRSLDCAAGGLDGCEALARLDPLQAWQEPRRPFVHPDHRHDLPQPLQVVLTGFVELPGLPAEP